MSFKDIIKSISHLDNYLKSESPDQQYGTEQPLRAELFSIDQLTHHIKILAKEHEIDVKHKPDGFLPRLDENEKVLLQAYKIVMAAVEKEDRITPAAEWLIDNFYLIEEQIRTARRHLPRGYSRELPRLLKGLSAGEPRIYAIALELISHSDGRLDAKTISSGVSAYQTVTMLKLGELWAFPIMLRLALIENLRRVAARITAGRLDRNNAKLWAERLMEVVESNPKDLIMVMADLAKSQQRLSSAFVVELVYRLQGQNPALAFPIAWIGQQLSGMGLTIELILQLESKEQATDRVSISNSIGSLRFLDALDWHEFVETMSIVERTLCDDPADIYNKMDFATRDHYRHVVEEMSRYSPLSEMEIARTAIGLANKNVEKEGQHSRTAHIGFYLIDRGLAQLKRAIHYKRLSIIGSICKLSRRLPFLFYFGPIFLGTVIITMIVLTQGYAFKDINWVLILSGTFLLICTSQFAVSVVNCLATLWVTPKPLPKMDYSKGIPTESRTLVVIPTMLSNPQDIEKLLDGLEVRYLANQDKNLHFGLLTDFCDAPNQTMPEDEQLVRLVQTGINRLNEKYKDKSSNTFFLFHRPRLWNAQEQIWMGYERKRGKIAELNTLLREGDSHGHFSLITGDTSILPNIKYVITLDTDTHLPRDSAQSLVETIAHPLNHPQYDKNKQLIRNGYTIIQPRVEVSISAAGRSLFAKLLSGESGIDPYTKVVSDIYQDVFHEGSFIGKGIYDVDAFMQALHNRLPENLILSHDLLEGCYARVALASDICLYEEYPDNYIADQKRRHRWIRGDWQIIQWLFSRIPGPGKERQKNPLSMLSQWKILDNIRRSLLPAALVILLILSWTVLTPAWLGALILIGVIMASPILCILSELFKKPDELPINLHLRVVGRSILKHFIQPTLTIIFLPYEAFYSLDAIGTSLIRMAITHKRLLQWVTFSEQKQDGRFDLAGFCRSIWIAPAIALTIGFYLISKRPELLVIAMPFLVLWFISPVIAWWLSRPTISRKPKLTGEQNILLRKLSRKTWSYFEVFVGTENNWLPIDNYQEGPVETAARRTSPTNIGLSLLANLAAYDFGYVSVSQLIGRTNQQLQAMEKLERFHGHFYNWYDTQSLKPLTPIYISTVDSGNLAGYLLTLKSGLVELPNNKIIPARLFEGLADTLLVISDIIDKLVKPEERTDEFSDAGKKKIGISPEALMQLNRLQDELKNTPPRNNQDSPQTLKSAKTQLDHILILIIKLIESLGTDIDGELKWWMNALKEQCQNFISDLTSWTPWFLLPEPIGPQSEEVNQILNQLDNIPTLNETAKFNSLLVPKIDNIINHSNNENTPVSDWLIKLKQAVIDASNRATEEITAINKMILQCDDFMDMRYDLLYDQGRNLMIIGYNVTEHRRDNSYYDLLASESRLCSFVTIARGELPQKHWFALGRLLTTVGGQRVLLSWGGSMFEYLMPLLIMPTYENTLLDQTYKAVVKRQIDYGKQRGVPWGISESCFNMTDVQLNYQYRAFGVPGLGFRRELADDLVIAPYASVMALMVAPEKACANLQRMTDKGFQGRYGFYEAIDYTPSRLTHEQANAVIRSFMTHHQGMSFLSLAYLLLNQPMQKRMKSNPLFQATELLLQERIPKTALIHPRLTETSQLTRLNEERDMPFRIFKSPDTPIPEVHILSNGRYHVMVTNSGGGYSRWKGLALTRWREDATRDNWGMFCYIRDVTSGEVWSATYQPTLKKPNDYEAIFTQGRVEFRRRDHNLDTHTEITVSPEDDIELRRINILNRSHHKRTVELTTYAEVVMSPMSTDETHAAFNNLFVQTQIIREHHSILCTRRPRSKSDPVYWMSHMMTVHGKTIGVTSYETDRSKFIGRSRSTINPSAMDNSFNLSNSEGPVLDPIVAIRRRITIEPEETVVVDIVSGIAETRERAIKLMEKYKDRHMNDRVFAMAWTHGQVILSQIKVTENDAQLYGRLASSIIYHNAFRRANMSILMTNRRGQSGLWGYGISGDLPIVLLKIGNKSKIELVHQLVQAHAYWRIKGLSVDMVIWNEDYSSYRQALQEQILSLIATSTEAQLLNRPGGIFVKQADQIPPEDKVLMQSVARIIVTDSEENLSGYVERRRQARINIPQLIPKRSFRMESRATVEKPHRDLIFFNGLGGFTHDGREYVITIMPNQARPNESSSGRTTPMPWLNVLANQNFGTIITESGGSYTWGENAHQFRLTPWYNDPVCDTTGEALYIRDEESGKFWSPTPLPAGGLTPYITRHGFGYSVFEHNENGIISELWVYVAVDAAVKFLVLKIRNKSGRTRRLSVTGYFELVLGELRQKEAMHVISEIDPDSGALFAHNFYNTDFAGRVAFLDVNALVRNVTADRNEFLGRNGTAANPDAMKRVSLSGKVGAALDPCAAMQVPFELTDEVETEIIFTMGIGHNIEDARSLVSRFRGSEPARYAMEVVWQYWNRTLGVIHIETPDQSINMLTNGWLLYQTLACRIWARSGYYQSGGAFGFRDQLQDVMALLYSEPAIVRQHLLTCAAHQFSEGDVQHWWHPPSGKGVRTHCSDDYLWLPFVTYRYVTGTGDTGILDERINFITDHPVNPNEDAYYGLPMRSEESAILYEHCVRAIKHGVRLGQHGLPLIGSGDWNDSFNLVGAQGKGESVWLGFFLHMVLVQFSEIAQKRGDAVFAEYCIGEAMRLRQNIEQNGWDGEWYRRAYFDNGELLGSANNPECRIDSLPQSWAVLSGAGDPKRAQMAMEAVNKHLVRRTESLIQLFTPPFDKSDSEPGYVKGYIPGIRENGGQYTHAAIWTIMAFATLGNNQRAWELLSLINPINDGDTPEKIALYKVEPYVMAADVYSIQPHIGRGGWTWYTGAAGWMYRLIVESLLGLRLEVNKLRFNPCLPAEWTSFKMHYRHYETFYHITISQTGKGRNVTKVILDGIEQKDMTITLNDDRQNHSAQVEIS